MRRTLQVCSSAECSANSSDDTDPQVFIVVEQFPGMSNLSAGRFVDAVQLFGPVQSDLDDVLRRKGYSKVFVILQVVHLAVGRLMAGLGHSTDAYST